MKMSEALEFKRKAKAEGLLTEAQWREMGIREAVVYQHRYEHRPYNKWPASLGSAYDHLLKGKGCREWNTTIMEMKDSAFVVVFYVKIFTAVSFSMWGEATDKDFISCHRCKDGIVRSTIRSDRQGIRRKRPQCTFVMNGAELMFYFLRDRVGMEQDAITVQHIVDAWLIRKAKILMGGEYHGFGYRETFSHKQDAWTFGPKRTYTKRGSSVCWSFQRRLGVGRSSPSSVRDRI